MSQIIYLKLEIKHLIQSKQLFSKIREKNGNKYTQENYITICNYERIKLIVAIFFYRSIYRRKVFPILDDLKFPEIMQGIPAPVSLQLCNAS